MIAPFKPQIQQHLSGLRADNCILDLNNNFSKNVVELKARAGLGTQLFMYYTFIPDVESGRGPEMPASRDIGEFSPSSLIFKDPSKWEKIVWKPGPGIVSGQVKALAKFRGPSGTHEEKMEIRVLAVSPKVYFDLSPANIAMIHLKKKDGDTADYTHKVEGRFRFSGHKGCQVRLTLAYEGTSGGHIHGDYCDPVGWRKSIGEFSGFNVDGLSTFELDGSRWGTAVNYTSYGVCGSIFAKAEFLDKKTGLVYAIRKFKMVVEYRGNFIELKGSDDIKLIGKTDEHLENHFGTPALISAIQKLAADYCKAFDEGKFDILKFRIEPGAKESGNFKFGPYKPGPRVSLDDLCDHVKPKVKKLEVNDMSLINGGRFDCQLKDTEESKKKPFQSPHKTHMFGEQVDINYTRQSNRQRDWFKENALKYFQFVGTHGKKGSIYEHWHCSIPLS
ncbi:hypothetical protein LLH00_15540 [bacterium]|nr:hypothetical protein [bacterium]